MTIIPEDYIKVLDKGYVGLKDTLGSDLTPADAARTSFSKSADQFSDEQNNRLVDYLVRNDEFACFRHQAMTFEIRMPVMIARQFWKYIVGSSWKEDQLGWNENSRRYITDDTEFYLPGADEWRKAPENKKQGSAGLISEADGATWTQALESYQRIGLEYYSEAVEAGLAPEQARLFLAGYGVYVTCYWTTSLNALFHVLTERLDNHAQLEIQLYAQAINQFVEQEFPVSMEAYKRNGKL